MDIAIGPCAPLAGRKRPLAGRFAQARPERQNGLEALFETLTGRPAAEAWAASESKGPGRLQVVSDRFFGALLEIESARRAANSDEARYEVYGPIAASWRERRRLASDRGSVSVTEMDVVQAAFEAGRARDKHQRLFAWFGPGMSLWSAGKVERVAETRTFRSLEGLRDQVQHPVDA